MPSPVGEQIGIAFVARFEVNEPTSPESMQLEGPVVTRNGWIIHISEARARRG
jgi:hypothetical protein